MSSALLLLAMLASQLGHVNDVTIPLVNRPDNFSGAAGVYRIEVHAVPTTVQVEAPVTLTIKVISLEPGPWSHPPQREKLHVLPPKLDADFFVEPMPELDRFLPGERAWEFTWRLMPRHEKAAKIPAPEFVYYHTAGVPGFKAAAGATGIALEVKPRPALLLTAPGATRVRFEQFVEGPRLLRQPWSRAQRAMFVIGGLVLPPFLCFAGYFVWWRLFPDAAESLRRRRGRALKTALKQLRKLRSPVLPAQVHAVFADYLRLRLALPPGEPTPLEVQQALHHHDIDGDLAAKTEAMLKSFDAVLFAPPGQVEANHFKYDVKALMQNLEAGLCLRKSL
jgi:hypothetical protein